MSTVGKSPSYCLRLSPAFLSRLESAVPRRPIASLADVIKCVHGRLPEPTGKVQQFRIDPQFHNTLIYDGYERVPYRTE